jgi:hypothetical protein
LLWLVLAPSQERRGWRALQWPVPVPVPVPKIASTAAMVRAALVWYADRRAVGEGDEAEPWAVTRP